MIFVLTLFQGELVFARHPIGTKTLNVERDVRIEFDKVISFVKHAKHRGLYRAFLPQAISPLFPFSLSEKLEIITEWREYTL